MRCLRFIQARIDQTGVAPSYPEMAEHLGVKSRSGVHAMVDRLVREGHLLKTGAGSRNLRLPGVCLAAVPTEALRAELERRP